nr:MAG: hypothetical protein [Leptochloa chinensis tombus-like virus 1]
MAIIFDLERSQRELDTILRLDAEKDLDIVEENLFVSITVFCQTWLQKTFGVSKADSRRADVLREVITSAVEEAHDDPKDYVEEHVTTSVKTTYDRGEVTNEVVRSRTTQRLVKGNRSKFAGSLAQRVKVKFGNLRYNEANRIMVHRWLSKLVEEEFKDLRTADKILALERATFMAFVMSEDFLRYQVLFESSRMKDRLLAHFGGQA